MAVHGDVRVSAVHQADEGESRDVKRRRIEGYAQVLGVTVDRVFIERSVSGSKRLAERPDGAKLLAELRRGDMLSRAGVAKILDPTGCGRSAADAGRHGAPGPRDEAAAAA